MRAPAAPLRAALLAALLAAGAAAAQDFGVTPGTGAPLPDPAPRPGEEIITSRIVAEPLGPSGAVRPRETPVIRVEEAPGAVLRGLDKVSGAVTDLALGVGESARFGRLTVTLGGCRYPANNPSAAISSQA